MESRPCPQCGKPMDTGFVQAGEEGEHLLAWCCSDPRESVERPEVLKNKPAVHSFRLGGGEASCVNAVRCRACRIVQFQY